MAFDTIVISVPYREKIVAEVSFDHTQWLEIHQEEGVENLRILFFPNRKDGCWTLPLEEAIGEIDEAQRFLLQIDPLPLRKKEAGKFTVQKKRTSIQIQYDSLPWAEISQDKMIIFHPHPKNKYWDFSIDEMWNALDEAKRVLEASPDS